MRQLLVPIATLSIGASLCGVAVPARAGVDGPSGGVGVSYSCEAASDSAFEAGGATGSASLRYDFADGTAGNVARVGLGYTTALSVTGGLANEVFIGLPGAATADTCLVGGSVTLTHPFTFTTAAPLTQTNVVEVRAILDGWEADVPAGAPQASDTSFGFQVGLGGDFVSDTLVLDTAGLTSGEPVWSVSSRPEGGISVSGTLVITHTLAAPTGPFLLEFFADQFAFVPGGTTGISITNSIPADAFRFEVVSLTPGLGVVTLGAEPPPVDEPQTNPQQKCLTTLNKALVNVVKAQAKVNEKCLKDAFKGKESSAQSCVVVDPKGRVQKASVKAMQTDEKNCQRSPEQLPTFSYVPSSSTYPAAMNETQAYLADLLGANADATIPSDNGDAGCQQKVIKSGDKVLLGLLSEAIKAKKKALKDGAGSPEALEAAMLAALADSKKVPKLEGKVGSTAEKKCADVADLGFLFPGTAAVGATPASVAAEATRAARCRACLLLDTFDALSLDCDALDDGAADASCP